MSRKVAFSVAAVAGVAGGYYYYSNYLKAPIAPIAALNPEKWVDLKLKSFKDVSPDSREFVFALPSENHVAGLETASCILAKYVTAKGNNVIRPYTPISDPDEKGEMTLLIKRYPKSKFGNYIFGLKENDSVSFKGPMMKWKWTPNSFDEITLIGGGSGITPLYQLLRAVANNPNDKTKVHLIYGSKTAEDILLKKEIDDLAAKHADKIKVDYFLDKPSESVKDAKVGYITKDFLEKAIPKPSEKSHVFVCGPPPLYKAISGEKASKTDQGDVKGVLGDLGFSREHVFKF